MAQTSTLPSPMPGVGYFRQMYMCLLFTNAKEINRSSHNITNKKNSLGLLKCGCSAIIAAVITLQHFLLLVVNIFSYLSECIAMHMLAQANKMGLGEVGEVVTKLTTLMEVPLFPKFIFKN